jgi:hypothetical protein
MPKKLITPEIIQKIKEELQNGKNKYQIAKEMNITNSLVYYHTNDIPSNKLGWPGIRGKSLMLLKQLLQDGYAHTDNNTRNNFITLKKHFPMINRAQIDGKTTIYYMSDKNRIALKALLSKRKSKIINYHILSQISKVFDVNLSIVEKNDIIGKRSNKIIPVIRKKEGGFMSSYHKFQMKLDDFYENDGLPHKNLLKVHSDIHSPKRDSLLGNDDSLIDFCIRMY